MSSLQAIADSVGVSRSTVAAVLRGESRPHQKRAAERAARILAAAQKIGYRPNSAAKAVSSGRFGCATLVITSTWGRSNLPHGLLSGIHDQLAQNNMHLTFVKLSDEELTREGVGPKILREQMSDGLLLNYTDHIPAQLQELIVRDQVPAVWLNSKQDHDCVRPDDFRAAIELTTWVIRSGRRRIAYADFSHGSTELDHAHYSAADRLAGYRHAVQAAGLETYVIQGATPVAREVRKPLIDQALASGVDAVISYSAAHAESFVFAALRRGMRVHDDLLLATFAGEPVAFDSIRIPVMMADHARVGSQAVEMLTRKIQFPERKLPTEIVPFTSNFD